MLFIADSLYVNDHPAGMELRHPRHAHLSLEPVTLLAALAMVTDRIGLAATISTTYNAPYGVARALASLDHISRGRAGWNVVTSQSDLEARNLSPVSTNGTDLRLCIKEGWGFVAVTKERR
jgi:alkanesulfonate monooxygenase SsuD/methylene tetrahydromethanopterin reductase-like flavin-dependent oxidoreductase (luciferase family)